MNIYFCNEFMEESGLYVVAPSRGKAKALYSAEIGEPYTEIRCRIVKRGVNADYSGTIDYGDPDMKRFDLHYVDPDTYEDLPNE